MEKTKKLRILSIALLVVIASVANGALTVVNHGFEEPGTGKIQDDFSLIPGWSQDVTNDSGVEPDGAYTGAYRGFGMTTDSEIYQLLDEQIIEGATYYLKFYGMDTWSSNEIVAEFYYLTDPCDPTSRLMIADQNFPVTGEWTEYILSFVAESGQAYLGQKLGIQFSGLAEGTGWYGLDEISVERIQPEYAKYPDPYDGEIDVLKDRILKWEPGIYAASHNVYFGEDMNAVENATTASSEYKGNRDVNNWDPNLAFVDKTYYWRIDEVNIAEPNSPWKGDVWEFTVQGHEKLETFESYITSGPKAFYSNWLDGWTTHTGAAVGCLRTDTVYAGKQSMALCYFNHKRDWGCWSVVETDVSKLEYSTDWTANDIGILTLRFYGDPLNEVYAKDKMYVALEDGDANRAVVQYSGDANDINVASWQVWNIPLAEFVGVDMTNVSKIYIGIGEEGNNSSNGGMGAVYFDEIRLYPIYEE